jgi:Xaa-Pro aminopeptidase
MQTIQPTLKRGRNVWDTVSMPESEFRGRLARIRSEMQKSGLDVLLIYGYGVNEYGYPAYVSDCTIKMSRGAMVIVPLTENPALLSEGPASGLPELKRTTWIEDIRTCESVTKEGLKFLTEKKLVPAKVGLVGVTQLMPYNKLKALREGLAQSRVTDATPILQNMRMAKSLRECDQIKRAGRLINTVFTLAAGKLLPGLNEKALEALMEREAYLEGAEDCRVLLARPAEEKWAFRPGEDQALAAGDRVIVYMAIGFERYWAEAARTFVVGASPSEMKSNDIKRLYAGIMSGMKPGKSISQFYREVQEQIQKAGFAYIPDYGLGDGIGLSLTEAPALGAAETAEFKEGMCFSLRLAVHNPEAGAIVTGNTVYISADKPESLTK